MMHAVVHEAVIGQDLARRVERHLTTPWRLQVVPPQDAAEVRRAIAAADALIGHRWPADILAHARAVKLVQCTGAGLNGIAAEAIPPAAALCNVYEHEIPIAEYVMMGVLMSACGVRQREADLRRGHWTGSGRVFGEFHQEIHGRTLGLVGLGRIGREVALRARAFGMRILAVRREQAGDPLIDDAFRYDRLHDFLAQCDYVVLSCPLTDQTRDLIGEAELACMRSSAVLVNPSRAEIVQEQPLYDALARREIGGAVLDAWYQYPPAGETGHGSRLAFHELDNVVLTPHLAAWTEPMVERRMTVVADNLDRLSRGQPLRNRVDARP